MGLTLLPPCVNESTADFSVKRGLRQQVGAGAGAGWQPQAGADAAAAGGAAGGGEQGQHSGGGWSSRQNDSQSSGDEASLGVSQPGVIQAGFSQSGDAILFGLKGVRGVPRAAVDEIIQKREEGGRFLSVWELCDRVSGSKVTRRALESLAHAGALDGLVQARGGGEGRGERGGGGEQENRASVIGVASDCVSRALANSDPAAIAAGGVEPHMTAGSFTSHATTTGTPAVGSTTSALEDSLTGSSNPVRLGALTDTPTASTLPLVPPTSVLSGSLSDGSSGRVTEAHSENGANGAASTTGCVSDIGYEAAPFGGGGQSEGEGGLGEGAAFAAHRFLADRLAIVGEIDAWFEAEKERKKAAKRKPRVKKATVVVETEAEASGEGSETDAASTGVKKKKAATRKRKTKKQAEGEAEASTAAGEVEGSSEAGQKMTGQQNAGGDESSKEIPETGAPQSVMGVSRLLPASSEAAVGEQASEVTAFSPPLPAAAAAAAATAVMPDQAAEIKRPQPLILSLDQMAERLRREKELLGFYVTQHPVTAVASQLPGWLAATSLDDCWMEAARNLQEERQSGGEKKAGRKGKGKWKGKAEVRVVGMVDSVAARMVRKSGQEMAVIELDDGTAQREVTVFPGVYGAVRDVIKEGELVLAWCHAELEEKEEDEEGEGMTAGLEGMGGMSSESESRAGASGGGHQDSDSEGSDNEGSSSGAVKGAAGGSRGSRAGRGGTREASPSEGGSGAGGRADAGPDASLLYLDALQQRHDVKLTMRAAVRLRDAMVVCIDVTAEEVRGRSFVRMLQQHLTAARHKGRGGGGGGGGGGGRVGESVSAANGAGREAEAGGDKPAGEGAWGDGEDEEISIGPSSLGWRRQGWRVSGMDPDLRVPVVLRIWPARESMPPQIVADAEFVPGLRAQGLASSVKTLPEAPVWGRMGDLHNVVSAER